MYRNYFYSITLLILLMVGINLVFLFRNHPSEIRLGTEPQEVHIVYDWNLPRVAQGQFDGDSREDVIVSDGCVYMTATENDTADENCEERYSTVDGDELALQGRKVFRFPSSFVAHYFVLRRDDEWYLYLRNNLSTDVYRITDQGQLEAARVRVSDHIDTAFYFVTHLIPSLLS